MQKPSVLPVNLAGVPASLQEIPRWVLWKYCKRPKKKEGMVVGHVWAKVPFRAADGQAASSTAPADWCDFDTASALYELGGWDGIGIVLGDGLHGIDLDDCRDPDTGELNKFATEIVHSMDLAAYVEVSPSGTGIKIFLHSNLDQSRVKRELGLEMYLDGRYFTVTGQAHQFGEFNPDVTIDVGWIVEEAFSEPLSDSIPTKVSGSDEERQLALYKPALEDWDADRVRTDLAPYVDKECHYDDWIKIGQALYHQFGEDGFELWDEMFREGSKYSGPEYGQERWRSFSEQRAVGRGPVTLATVIKMTADARGVAEREARDAALNQFKAEVQACQDVRLLEDNIAAKIAACSELSRGDREQLAVALQGRCRELGVRLPIAVLRGWIRPPLRRLAEGAPAWLADWVYITAGDKFFNLDTKEEVTATGFRAKFDREMAMREDGTRERADQMALQLWNLPVVVRPLYLPGAEAVFEMDGLEYVNLYRPGLVPEIPEPSAAGDAAVATVQRHLALMLPDERERGLFLSWLAYCVRSPGAKIRWSPYLHGVPGDGKSFFGDLLAATMGHTNVRVLNGSTLESSFTDWAVGQAVAVVEEMKQHGHNRFDIMNKVKPYISNLTVDVHPKGKAAFTTFNVSNYLFFSNYMDGAPVEEGDRRFMFLSGALGLEQVRAMTREGYYARLFTALRDQAGALRGWLMSVELSAEFDANGQAPMTDAKTQVVEMSISDAEADVIGVVGEGALGVGDSVISSSHLTTALWRMSGERPRGPAVKAMLSRLGFGFFRRMKWDNQACRVWVKRDRKLSEEEAREALERTRQESATLDFLE